MNSQRVSSSVGESEYIVEIGRGQVPSSKSIFKSYRRCGASLLASDLLNTLA